MMPAWILGDTALVIQVPTMLFAWIQAWICDRVFTIGDERVRVPLINPTLFLEIKSFLIEQAQAG